MPFWYSNSKLAWLFLPFSLLFWLISQIRRALFSLNILSSYKSPKPVIIVGNLSVGGNGKTPVVVWLVEELQKQGLRVGVISRGYGSQSKTYPLLVTPETDPVQGGDEPVLIAKRTGVPVVISPNRQQAIELLLKTQDCDLILSDDGLQHYKLRRDIEIVVMDAERALGNGFVLPAGPLRELPSRLKNVDFVITNGGKNAYSDVIMTLVPHYAINLVTAEKRLLSEFTQGSAIAGIGNPQRFFTMLENLNIRLENTKAFQDHQHFEPQLLEKLNEIGAHYGVGVVDIVENRLVGMKSRGVYENPGGSIIMYAHRELEYLCLDRATYHYKELIANKYAELVYDGMWFAPLMYALQAFVDETQKTVTGDVKLKLYKGNIISAGATSPYSLYSEDFVTFEEDDVYNQADAAGFINLFGLPLKINALMKEKAGK